MDLQGAVKDLDHRVAQEVKDQVEKADLQAVVALERHQHQHHQVSRLHNHKRTALMVAEVAANTVSMQLIQGQSDLVCIATFIFGQDGAAVSGRGLRLLAVDL